LQIYKQPIGFANFFQNFKLVKLETAAICRLYECTKPLEAFLKSYPIWDKIWELPGSNLNLL